MTELPTPPGTAPAIEPDEEHGRIGYGRLARFTPIGLAVALVALIVAVLIVRQPDESPTGSARLVGKPAPEATLTTFDGNTIALAELEGSVVVINFWAEWCAPCREEMPAFQRVHQAAQANGQRLVILGVDIKQDWPDRARPFLEELGITYPTGQDTAGTDARYGAIQLAFEIDPTYPTTVFIRPDGVIDAVRIGPMTENEIRERITAAASPS